MNDRTSAAPPVFFIGPEDEANAEPRHVHLPHHHQHYTRSQKLPTVTAIPAPTPAASRPTSFEKPASQQAPVLSKRGSKQILGQVWDGVREKLRMRRDGDEDAAARRKKKTASVTGPPVAAEGKVSKEDERPSRDEVYANYHQLVASGFFSSHAIQSTRQPAPGATVRPTPSPRPASPPAAAASSSLTPQWPLTPTPATPNRSHNSSPVKSPASASSRGTKRPSISLVDGDADADDSHPLHNRKLRKTASTSRDLAVPRTRSTSRTILSRRSFSQTNRVPSGTEAADQQKREPNKLTKRVLSRLPAGDDSSSHQSYLFVPTRNSSARHMASEKSSRDQEDAANSNRTLRPRRSAAEPLRVKPDANRGIPIVPDIPVKFTYGEDRENGGPWKGLRRANVS